MDSFPTQQGYSVAIALAREALSVDTSDFFEQPFDSLSYSTSSSFSMSGCMTPFSVSSSAMSRRPSKSSESGLTQYMCNSSPMASTIPNTTPDVNNFDLGPLTVEPRSTTVLWPEDMAFADDHPMTDDLGHNFTSAMLQPDIHKTQQSYTDEMKDVFEALSYSDQEHLLVDPFPRFSGPPVLSQPVGENYLNSERSLETSMNEVDRNFGIVPSQTLVQQMTPKRRQTDSVGSLMRSECTGAKYEAASYSPRSVDITIIHSETLPSTKRQILPRTKRRVTKRNSLVPVRPNKSSTGIKVQSHLYDILDSGASLPLDQIVEKPKDNRCRFIDKNGERCTKSFARNEHLTRHEKTHTNEVTEPCPVCGTVLKGNRTDNLKTHIWKTHVNPSPSGRNPRHWLDEKRKETDARVTEESLWCKVGLDLRAHSKKRHLRTSPSVTRDRVIAHGLPRDCEKTSGRKQKKEHQTV